MIKHILRLLSAVVLLSLSGCAPRNDVEITAPDLALDTINPQIPFLAVALPKNPTANTFRLSWRIVPDPTRPLENLPHSFVYNRSAKTLIYHRSMRFYDVYSGATDKILQAVAAKKGGVRMLTRLGCKLSSAAED